MGAAGFPFDLTGLTMSGVDRNKHIQHIACLGQKRMSDFLLTLLGKVPEIKSTRDNTPQLSESISVALQTKKSDSLEVLAVRSHFKCADTLPWLSAGQLSV